MELENDMVDGEDSLRWRWEPLRRSEVSCRPWESSEFEFDRMLPYPKSRASCDPLLALPLLSGRLVVIVILRVLLPAQE